MKWGGFLLTACILAPAYAADEEGLRTVRLQLKWLHQFQFAGYYAAIEQGYYRDAGLRVELFEPGNRVGKELVETVVEGRADYGIAASDLIVRRAEGTPVVALAAIFQNSPLALITTREKGIHTIQELVEKEVMIEHGSADLFALLRASFVPVDAIKPMRYEASGPLERLEKADVLAAYITNEPFLLRQADLEPVVFMPQSAGINFYGDLLFTTEERIEENPREVRAFVDATLRGWEYALEHPEEVVDLILSDYPTDKSRDHLRFEAGQSARLIRGDMVPLGSMHRRRWEHIASVFREHGMLDGPLDLDAFVYPTYPEAPRPRNFLPWLLPSLLVSLALGLLVLKLQRDKRTLRREIGLRRQTEEAMRRREEEYRAFHEGAPLAFITWDRDLRVKTWNRAAETTFGWREEEVRGRIATEFMVPQSDLATVKEGRTTLSNAGNFTRINRNLTKDGRVIWCQWHNVPRKNAQDEIAEFHSIAVDVTLEVHERENREKALARAAEDSLLKGKVLAETSHEIKTPLNAILGFAEILREDCRKPETLEMIDIIREAALSMNELLNDLLDSSKLEAGKMIRHLSDFDLKTLIRKKSELFRPQIERKGLSFSVRLPEPACPIRTDKERLGQILNNLLSNAAKFTSEGAVEVHLALFEDPEPHYRIDVRDSGPGLHPEQLQKIFDPYVQAEDDTHKKYGGTGLGLSLSRRLAEFLGGELTAQSRPGAGSTFTVSVPRHPKDPTP